MMPRVKHSLVTLYPIAMSHPKVLVRYDLSSALVCGKVKEFLVLFPGKYTF